MIRESDGWPTNSEAELQALDAVCDRLQGFGHTADFEYVDGYLTALAAGPVLPSADVWIERMIGDDFARVFADPPDAAQATAALAARLEVLRAQLDPEWLLDHPDDLRLAPLVVEWTDEERRRLAENETVSDDQLRLLQTGTHWAIGFLDAIQRHADIWVEPAGEDAAAAFGELIDQFDLLIDVDDVEEHRGLKRRYYADEQPTREQLINEACFAAQELRVYWLDHAPKPETRRVEPTPGRNDPCPCGSGKKYKKCHGAAA
jgi:uncharacterized protein